MKAHCSNPSRKIGRCARVAGAAVQVKRRPAMALAVTVFGLLLGACSSSLEMKVESAVPAPLISQLPIHVGVHYPDGFNEYVFEQDNEDRGLWRIETGPAQVAMFQRILPAMCARIEEVSRMPVAQSAAVDAVLMPSLEHMELALPEETPFDFYEAWVRYKMHLLDRDGNPIAEWTVTGYGKVTDRDMFSSREDSLNAAINAALRDAGGQFALGFRQQQAVRNWLCNNTAASESAICRKAPAI